LQNPDFVVDPFHQTKTDLVLWMTVGGNTLPMGFNHLSELPVRLQTLPFQAVFPALDMDVSWEVKINETVIAQGSNTKYGYSPIWGGGRSGLAIGTVSTEKGKEYTLYVFTKNVSSDWNQGNPYIEVGLHPSKLEGYLVLQRFGLIIACSFGVVLVVVALIYVVAKRKMASNKPFQTDAAKLRG
jgi:hypothetical protein